MKIGVISDTHSFEIPGKVIEDLKSVDLIIHAGDFCSLKDIELLKGINKLEAVFGNMDDYEVRAMYPERQIIEVEDIKIGLYHGRGSSKEVLGVVKEEFKKDKVDIIIFGHSHLSFNENIDGVLFFNPGSPNDTIRAAVRSYGMIEVRGKAVSARIIELPNG